MIVCILCGVRILIQLLRFIFTNKINFRVLNEMKEVGIVEIVNVKCYYHYNH